VQLYKEDLGDVAVESYGDAKDMVNGNEDSNQGE
jgi:hypothetical protein